MLIAVDTDVRLDTACVKYPLVMAMLYTAILAINADSLKGQGSPQVTLLSEFRPIGGSGNNLSNPKLDPVPGAPELALAPLNFASGTNDGLVNAPNARVISGISSPEGPHQNTRKRRNN